MYLDKIKIDGQTIPLKMYLNDDKNGTGFWGCDDIDENDKKKVHYYYDKNHRGGFLGVLASILPSLIGPAIDVVSNLVKGHGIEIPSHEYKTVKLELPDGKKKIEKVSKLGLSILKDPEFLRQIYKHKIGQGLYGSNKSSGLHGQGLYGDGLYGDGLYGDGLYGDSISIKKRKKQGQLLHGFSRDSLKTRIKQ